MLRAPRRLAAGVRARAAASPRRARRANQPPQRTPGARCGLVSVRIRMLLRCVQRLPVAALGQHARARARGVAAMSSAPAAAPAASAPAMQQQQQAGAALAPFHIAVPTHDLAASRAFYGGLLGCAEGRSAATWVDWSLSGHQRVTHFAGAGYRGADHFNGVDADMVPVPHFGVCLTVPHFHDLAARLAAASPPVPFVVPPHRRFAGQPGEQWTMFFKDPSGNNLEFKAMVHPENLFAKYVVE